jgi:hypothetical protein
LRGGKFPILFARQKQEEFIPISEILLLFGAGGAESCQQTLNDGELKSVYALLAYVSHNENIRQETVQAIVEASFGVNHVARIQQKDYDEVIRFLVDLNVDEIKN